MKKVLFVCTHNAGFEPTGERRTIASDPDQMGVFLARPLTPNDRAHPHV